MNRRCPNVAEIERLTAVLDKMQIANISKAERIAKLEAFIEAPTKCVECGSWGPFEQQALQEVDKDSGYKLAEHVDYPEGDTNSGH